MIYKINNYHFKDTQMAKNIAMTYYKANRVKRFER